MSNATSNPIPVAEAARILGIDRSTLIYRITNNVRGAAEASYYEEKERRQSGLSYRVYYIAEEWVIEEKNRLNSLTDVGRRKKLESSYYDAYEYVRTEILEDDYETEDVFRLQEKIDEYIVSSIVKHFLNDDGMHYRRDRDPIRIESLKYSLEVFSFSDVATMELIEESLKVFRELPPLIQDIRDA